MNGTWALTRKEMVWLSRNKRYLIFSIALPVMLYLVFGKQAASTADGVAFAAFYMVGMACVGAFSGALTGNAQRISQERCRPTRSPGSAPT